MLGGRWSCRSSGSHEARSLPDVSPARGARSYRESKREKPRYFRGALLQRTRPLLCGGGPAAVPRSGSRSREAADSRPGARRATGTWARGPGCGRRAGRSGLGPEAPRFGPASPGWAQVTGRCAPGPRGHSVRALGSFSACSRRARVDTGPGAHISRVPSTVFRAACTARRVILRGLVLEPIRRGRAGQMASLRNGPRASAVPRTSGWTQS